MTDTDKQSLRQAQSIRLKSAAVADLEGRRSAALRCLLAPLLAVSRKLRVAVYAPLPHEVDLLPLPELYPQHDYCFPRCLKARGMEFRIVRDTARDMEPAAMGIPAPRRECPLVPPAELDIIIVPGLAFTERGERLGYGGGYYDRYLPRCPQAYKLALAFSEQILPQLPTDEYDCRLDAVIHL